MTFKYASRIVFVTDSYPGGTLYILWGRTTWSAAMGSVRKSTCAFASVCVRLEFERDSSSRNYYIRFKYYLWLQHLTTGSRYSGIPICSTFAPEWKNEYNTRAQSDSFDIYFRSHGFSTRKRFALSTCFSFMFTTVIMKFPSALPE